MKGLILTYALVLIGTFGAVWQPRIGLFVYVAFAVLRPQNMWGWAADFEGISWLVGVAMLAGWGLRGLGSWRLGRGGLIVGALLAFTAWYALAGAAGINPARSWVGLVNLSKIVLPFLVGVTILNGAGDARKLLWVIVLSQAYVAYEMNMSYLGGFNLAHLVGYAGLDNNALGVGMVATLGPALGLALSASKWPERAVALLGSAVILHTVLLTFSRGAMLGLLVAIFVAALVMPKRPRYLAGIVLVGLLALRLTGPELMARFESSFEDQANLDGSAQSRWDLWADCLTVAVANPLFGVGPNNWALVVSDFGWPAGKSGHSLWLEMTAETGFPGAFLLLLFYALCARRLLPLARVRGPRAPDHGDAAMALGMITAIAGYAVSAQFVTLPGLEVPYYVAIAGVALLKTEAPRAESVPALVRAPRPGQGRRAVLPVPTTRIHAR